MRKLIVALLALGSLAVPLALAQSGYPEKIALPNGFAPEGIEIGTGNTFYTGSALTGQIWVGDLRTGTGRILVPGATTAEHARRDRDRVRPRPAVGRRRRFRHRARLRREDGRAAARVPVRDAARDVHQRRRRDEEGAYFTDSQRPVLYRIALSKNGAPGAPTTIPLGGEYAHVAGQFNLNGIVATANGKTLIAVQSFSKKLSLIDPSPAWRRRSTSASYDLVNGDGLLLHGKTLYVVQNRRTRSPSSSSPPT